MRTTKIIKEESEKALEAYNIHCNSCSDCQNPIDCNGEEMTCYSAEWLYEDYDNLISELDYAEQVFQAELLERKELTTQPQ